ncbi:Chloride channel protein [Quillaja saponaria]|uniref:Chloride channel protein n=1 Tax=Quillaja saponaria TaxID=32244 RepID=A0AAD7Q4W8_QUISA|nr:Chloride channel protein [Quillaja saponaria]
MGEDSSKFEEVTMNCNMEREVDEGERDPESNPLNEPLLKRNRTLSSTPLALVGAKVSYIESLDYEINENDLFKHDWRSRSRAQVLQYIFSKWSLAFLVGLLTGIIATLINLAVENIAGYKLLAVLKYIEKERYLMGFLFFTGTNFLLTMVAACFMCVFCTHSSWTWYTRN